MNSINYQLIIQFTKQLEDKFFDENFCSEIEKSYIQEIKKNPSIYDGYGGILLFLIYSYDIRSKKNEVVRWEKLEFEISKLLILKVNDRLNNLYFGNNSIAFLYLELYQVRKTNLFLNKSISIILENKDKLLNDVKNDLLLGKAGNIILCCKVYKTSKCKEIRNLLKKLVRALIKETKLSPTKGINWNIDINVTQPLNGFSHGNAGIIFALIEGAHTIKKKSILDFVIQGVKYEDTSFVYEAFNWPDYRTENLFNENSLNIINSIIKKNDEKSGLNFMYAWCHGSPGIILSRINYIEHFNLKKYKYLTTDILERIYYETKKMSNNSFCHGICGNAIILNIASKINSNKVLQGFAEELINNSIHKFITEINNSELKVKDYSLFTGLTGVGLMLASLIEPEYNFIFYPKILPNKVKVIPKIKKLEFDSRRKLYKVILKNYGIKLSSEILIELEKKPINYSLIRGVLKRQMKLNKNSTTVLNYLKIESLDYKFNLRDHYIQNKEIENYKHLDVEYFYDVFSTSVVYINPYLKFENFKNQMYLCHKTSHGYMTMKIDKSIFLLIINYLKDRKIVSDLYDFLINRFNNLVIKEIVIFIKNLVEKRILILKRDE